MSHHHHRHHTLQQGSRGEAVTALQHALCAANYPVSTDGIFGRGTHNAVMSFQCNNGLDEDGIVGPRTWQALIDIIS